MSPSTPPAAVSPSASTRSRSSLSRSRQGSLDPGVQWETREDDTWGRSTPRPSQNVRPCITSKPTAASKLTHQPPLEPSLATKSSPTYSPASGHGIVSSSTASSASTETGTPPLTVHSGIVSIGGPTQATPEGLNATGTTSFGQQSRQQVSLGNHLTPCEFHVDTATRTGGALWGDHIHRGQPTRSRSLAKRRFSGSTAASSHSPSSDRTGIRREKEEGMYADY